jgi:hypothetical protein
MHYLISANTNMSNINYSNLSSIPTWPNKEQTQIHAYNRKTRPILSMCTRCAQLSTNVQRSSSSNTKRTLSSTSTNMESLSHSLTLTVKHYKKFSHIQAQSGITTHVRVRAHDRTHNRTHKQEHVPVPIKSKANHKAPHPHSPQHHAPIQMALHTLACMLMNKRDMPTWFTLPW